MSENGHYRPCVGIMLLNGDGLVFVGRRRAKRASDHVGAGHLWQMPQGGIDPGEDPYQAALRELAEETNVTSVELLAEAPDWYSYDLPSDATKKVMARPLPGSAPKMVRVALQRRGERDRRAGAGRRGEARVRHVALGAHGGRCRS